jgi:hypothetical protein
MEQKQCRSEKKIPPSVLAAMTDPECSIRARVKNLGNFTGLLVNHARRLAKDGHQDNSRILLRFVCNSGIYKILAEVGLPDVEGEANLALLSNECHPSVTASVASFATDLQVIRQVQSEVLDYVKQIAASNVVRARRMRSRVGEFEQTHPVPSSGLCFRLKHEANGKK